MQGRFWPIALVSLCLLLLAGGIGQVAGSFTDSETSVGNGFQSWTSTQWLQTTQADFEAGIVPSQADTRSSPGDVGLARANRVFAFQGGSANFWAYGVPANSWASMASPPAPNTVGAGGALVYDGSWYIYAFRGGGNNRTFWRYDTTSNTWLARANALANVGTGGSLAYGGSGYIYAFRGGGNNRTFWRYDIAVNSWRAMANALARVGAGGSLAYDGSQYIYAFTGNTTTAFWRYNTASNSWTAMNSAPATVGAGGALAYDGSGYIYAFSGNGSNAFWRYDVLNNAWTVMAVAPGNVTDGGALAFVAASTYVSPATVASQVRDTGTPGDRWDALIWDETLLLNADIAFEVRASDTLFAAGDALPVWVSVGGTSPVTSALPSGRYMQWRATLTTSDTAVTPLLREVRLYHY